MDCKVDGKLTKKVYTLAWVDGEGEGEEGQKSELETAGILMRHFSHL